MHMEETGKNRTQVESMEAASRAVYDTVFGRRANLANETVVSVISGGVSGPPRAPQTWKSISAAPASCKGDWLHSDGYGNGQGDTDILDT